MVLGELLLSRFRWREAGFAGSSAVQVGLVGPVVDIRSNRMRFVTNFSCNNYTVQHNGPDQTGRKGPP